MTSKKLLGFMPCAESKSVPVIFSDFIAARHAWSIATQFTNENTDIMRLDEDEDEDEERSCLLMILAPRASASLEVKLGVKPPDMTFTSTWQWFIDSTSNSRSIEYPTGFGAKAVTVEFKSSFVETPSIKHTSKILLND